MTKPLPKWIMKSYAKMWLKFSNREFDHPQAIGILGQQHASVIISNLKKNGWIDATLNPTDSRKRFYKLKSPESAIGEMANE